MLIKNKHLDVKDILALVSKGKLVIKLLKVLNKAMGKQFNAPFLFSVANWCLQTKGFTKSTQNKPAGFIEVTTKMGHTALKDINTKMPLSSLAEDSDKDFCSLICEYSSFTLHPTNHHHYRV